MSATINIVGAGKVASSLARFWHTHGTFTIGDVVNSSIASAHRAVDFIGAGQACGNIAEMRPSSYWVIGVKDSDIQRIASDIACHDLMPAHAIVFHLSGALAARELAPLLQDHSAFGASVHLMRSFEKAICDDTELRNTWYTLEGDDEACDKLESLFKTHCAGVTRIHSDSKLTYHAASVFACNYLVSLVEIATCLLADCKIPRAQAMQMLGPLIDGTVTNLKRLPTASALTGPIARADVDLVAKQLAALQQTSPELAALYKQLGRIALDVARRGAAHTPEQYDALQQLLNDNS